MGLGGSLQRIEARESRFSSDATFAAFDRNFRARMVCRLVRRGIPSPHLSSLGKTGPMRSKQMICRVSVVCFAAGLLVPSFVQAAPAGGGSDQSANRGQGAGGSTVYDFEDDNVDGELLSPEGALITSRSGSKHDSLITIRAGFIPEMIKAARDI